MAFIENGTLKFTLTSHGKKMLIENGLVDTDIYFTLYDDEVIYRINGYPNLMSDINGVENKLSDKIKLRYKLNNG